MRPKHLLMVAIFLLISTVQAQQDTANDGQPPIRISGSYASTYYGRFADWQIFPVLLPIRHADPNTFYTERYDLTPDGQIIGRLNGGVDSGEYVIELPNEPTSAAWFDTDADPNTPSSVKVFMVGMSSGLVGKDYVSRYDFLYTRSFIFDPNTRLWNGHLLVWAAEENTGFPLLPGPDHRYYTADDVIIHVPQGWSVAEVKGKAEQQSARLYQATEPNIQLVEPTYLQEVDLQDLSYAEAFNHLLDSLERTYVFTDYRGVNWDMLRMKFGPQAENISTDIEFQRLLEQALFTFYDGHLTIYGPGLPDWLYGQIGLHVYPVEDELMVIEVPNVSPAAAQSNIRPGTVILSVNGQNAMDYFQSIPQTINRGGHDSQELWFRGGLAFRGLAGTVYDIEYRQPNDRIGQVSLATVPSNEVFNRINAPNTPVYYEILDSGIGVVTLLNFTSSQIDDLWDIAMRDMLANDISGLVVDLRRNGGGFSTLTNYLIGDFLDDDQYSGREVSILDEDGDGLPDTREEFYFARGKVFDPARVVVLVGPNCFSACEFAAQSFHDIGATVIGHLATGGAGGGVGASYLLPGQTRLYGMAIVRQEDPTGQIIIEGVGVPLDMQIPFTADGLASGRDVLLLTAEEYLRTLH